MGAGRRRRGRSRGLSDSRAASGTEELGEPEKEQAGGRLTSCAPSLEVDQTGHKEGRDWMRRLAEEAGECGELALSRV